MARTCEITYPALDCSRRKKEREEKIRIARLQEANARETAQRTHEADLTEHYYNLENNIVEDCCDTSPLLLDAVLTPISEYVVVVYLRTQFMQSTANSKYKALDKREIRCCLLPVIIKI